MTKYTQQIENENGWTDWIIPKVKNMHKICCCDCGLVHKIEFKNTKEGIIFRASRDNRATAQRRRNNNYE